MNNGNIKRWMTAVVGLAFVAAFVAAPALAEEKYEERFAKTEALAKNGRFALNNVSGDVEIAVWKETQVKIEALKTSKANSLDKAKENAAKVTIEVTKEGDVVRVETKYPKREGGFWGGDRISVSVDFKVWVPDQAAVDIHSISGDVVVAALGGKAKIHTVSGDVTLAGAAGVEINVKSGDIDLRNIVGDAFVETVSGDIDITGLKGSVEAGAISGDIVIQDVSGARTVGVKTISGDVAYAGGLETGGRFDLETHSGDVRMTIPAGSAFDLEANTFNGTIETDFEIKVVGKISPREIRGTVGAGGATIALKTFSGDVDLKKK